MEKISGFLGIFFAFIAWIKPDWFGSHGGESMSSFWLGVIPLAGGFSVFLVRWLWSAYAVFKECVQSGQKKYQQLERISASNLKIAEQEIQRLRQELLEMRTGRMTEDQQQVNAIAESYSKEFNRTSQPKCPFWKMKLLIESGLMRLQNIPDAAAVFEKAVGDLGLSNPFEGISSLGENQKWDTDKMWLFLPWAIQNQIFAGDRASDALNRYIEAIQPHLADNDAPDIPLITISV